MTLIACALIGLAGAGRAMADSTQEYRAYLKQHRSLFNTLMIAEKSKTEGLAGHLGLSEAMEIAEHYARLDELAPFVADCKRGKYRDARELALPPERGCALAEQAAGLLAGHMDQIVRQGLQHAGGNARAALDALKSTGCVENFEVFYQLVKPDAAQAKTAERVTAIYAKAKRPVPAGIGAAELGAQVEEAVTAAVAAAKPSKPAKKDKPHEALIVKQLTHICTKGVGRNPARGCTPVRAWMTTDAWEVFKNELDIPTRRTREAKVLLRLPDRKHCMRQHVVVAQDYRGKFGTSTAELGSGACVVPCK